MWLLHTRTDLFGRGDAAGNQVERPEPRDGGPHGPHARHGAGNPRAHERQHLPLRRVLEHHRGHRRRERREGDERMRPFTYERATTPAAAASGVARNPGAKFIAGGTNLLDLMKLEIEKPTHLIDVNGLTLDKIESSPD